MEEFGGEVRAVGGIGGGFEPGVAGAADGEERSAEAAGGCIAWKWQGADESREGGGCGEEVILRANGSAPVGEQVGGCVAEAVPAAAVKMEGDAGGEEVSGDGLLPGGDDELAYEGFEGEVGVVDAHLVAETFEVSQGVFGDDGGVGGDLGGGAFPEQAVGGELLDGGGDAEGEGVGEEADDWSAGGRRGHGQGGEFGEDDAGIGPAGAVPVCGLTAAGQKHEVQPVAGVGGDSGRRGEGDQGAVGGELSGEIGADKVGEQDGVRVGGESGEGQGRGVQGVVVGPGEGVEVGEGLGEAGEGLGGIVPELEATGGGYDDAGRWSSVGRAGLEELVQKGGAGFVDAREGGLAGVDELAAGVIVDGDGADELAGGRQAGVGEQEAFELVGGGGEEEAMFGEVRGEVFAHQPCGEGFAGGEEGDEGLLGGEEVEGDPQGGRVHGVEKAGEGGGRLEAFEHGVAGGAGDGAVLPPPCAFRTLSRPCREMAEGGAAVAAQHGGEVAGRGANVEPRLE